MKILTTLTVIAKLSNRLLDKLDEYNYERKQRKLEERRAAVAERPCEAFGDMFGGSESSESDGVRESADKQGDAVQSNTSAASVDRDR